MTLLRFPEIHCHPTEKKAAGKSYLYQEVHKSLRSIKLNFRQTNAKRKGNLSATQLGKGKPPTFFGK